MATEPQFAREILERFKSKLKLVEERLRLLEERETRFFEAAGTESMRDVTEQRRKELQDDQQLYINVILAWEAGLPPQ